LFACQTPGYSLWWDGNLTSPEYTNEDATTWIESASAGAPVEWHLTESAYGCSTIGETVAPAYSPVSAGFSINPGLECIPWDFLPIQMIDFSQFVVSGWWRARALDGDGEATTVWSMPYSQSESPVWQPDQPGHYEVLLQVENEGGCLSSDTAHVCIFAPVNWFLADQFSPNGDGLNDLLLVRSEPLNAFEMRVYNRWGEQVYTAKDPAEGWDGNQRNTEAPSGVYAIQLILDFADGTHLETLRHVTLVR
ncbi:MAG: gliding motility-associated C-terminal domain-containing protein, partial [Flavobacteriales bacterium]|nr:gliding motility-associated C-terminal domain-containing protein [Flavobacteriales bacterium]